jgi:hypothetical protein
MFFIQWGSSFCFSNSAKEPTVKLMKPGNLQRFALRFKTCVRSGLALGAILFNLTATANGVPLVDPSSPVAGKSQLALSEQWWQWALSAPAASNPLTDTTGALAQFNNTGSVFFLAGNMGGNTTRTFNVPYGPLFFPVLNYLDFETPAGTGSCLDQATDKQVQCALDFIEPLIDGISNKYVRVDGIDVLISPNFRQTSTAFFDVNLPSENLLGVPAGLGNKFVSDGYWVALQNLSPGSHTLEFGGQFGDGVAVNVIDSLNVIPEPATLLLILPALLGMVLVAERRRSGIRQA